MRKMSTEDEKKILSVIRKWPSHSITWEALRLAAAVNLGIDHCGVWSRQSLYAHETIRCAYKMAKQRALHRGTSASERLVARKVGRVSKQIEARDELAELQMKYDNLLLRHRRLLFNASLLPGGVHLLNDPLPNNTMNQRREQGGDDKPNRKGRSGR